MGDIRDAKNHVGEIIGTGLGGVLGFAGGLGLAVLSTPVMAPAGIAIGAVGGGAGGAALGHRLGGRPGAVVGGIVGVPIGGVGGLISMEGGMIVGGTVGGAGLGNMAGRKVDDFFENLQNGNAHGLNGMGGSSANHGIRAPR